jgi:hypothetical protein
MQRSPLAIVGVAAVLAGKMLVQQRTLHRFDCRVNAQRFACQPGEVLQDNAVVNGRLDRLTPGKRSVACDQSSGEIERIQAGRVLLAMDACYSGAAGAKGDCG